MGTILSALYGYHQLTQRYYLIKQQIESLRVRARTQERKLNEHLAQVERLKEQIKRAQASASEAELELKTREANIDRLRTQLNAAKTNKEYSAILREINTFKADTAKQEEQALSRMNEVDVLKKDLAGVQEQVAQEQQRVQGMRDQAESRRAELEGQLAALEEQRRQAAAAIPPEVVNQFNRVAEAHDGEAMAPVIRPHPKREDYICAGCNMGVTLELVNALQTRDDIQTCNVCGRMLYMPESISQATA